MSKRMWLTISCRLGLTAAVLGIACERESLYLRRRNLAKGGKSLEHQAFRSRLPGGKGLGNPADGIKDKRRDKRAWRQGRGLC